MADDIDIEEHDVLESLRRRHEQPDTSIVKSEPLEIEYEESNYEEPNYEYQWEDKVEIKIEPREQTENADEFRFGKIILGSKPDRLTEENGQVTAGTSQLSEEEYNYNMSLVLEDWGPILESSDCYCKICETLFATVNALDAHRMVAHSFLVATDKLPSPERNKAFKSTAKPSNVPLTNSDDMACKICHAEFKGNIRNIKSNLCRHYRNVHRVDPKTMNSSDFKSWRVCNHCNLYFPNDTSLVKHLYELLPLNDNKSPTKDDKRTVSQPVPKPLLNVGKNTPKAVKSTTSKNLNLVNSPMKNEVTVTPQPNRIILGSKPMAISENTNSTKINLSESQTQPNKIKLTDTKVRFKCLLCSEIFTTKYGAKKHRKKHPTRTKRQHIFVKFVNKNKAVVNPYLKKEPGQVKPVVKKYASKFVKKEVAEEDKGILVSKSTLFKCNRCSVHFLTCTGACQHSIVCESSSNIRDWACPRCQRVFKSAEKAAHEYQHRVLNANKFRVYVVYLEMIVRVLCQCPNCFVCFEEDKFWRHVDSGCNDAASYFCSECKLPIDIHSKANHDSKHKQGDFTRDDFIKVDYVCSKPLGVKKIETEVEARSPVKIKVERETPKGLKRKLELQEAPSRKRKKNLNDLILYYCQFCRSYIGNQSVVHLSGSCAEKTKQFVGFCHICGIHFKKKYHSTHMSWHVRCPNLVINDFTIVKLSDSKKTKPVQVLYPCKACNVNFLTKLHRFRHKCEETASTTCQICQKKIQANLFDTHWRIHNYVIPRQIKTIDDMINMPKTSQNDKKSPIKHKFTKTETKTSLTELPDLLMKYQSLTTLWNILYLCAICDTFTDSYDKVVEHCQNHLTNMENYGVVIKKCDKCNMKFDSECYKRHLELHAENKVNKKTFQILKYEHYNLFSENWFDFIDLPEEQKAQIVNRSIYGGNRCVKMKLIQQGPPEYTLYKCEKCTNCLTADNIVYHVKLANCCKANKILCSVCHMTFAIRRDCEEHEKTHESTGLDLQSFRIVSFNNSIDAEANKTIMSYDTDNHGSKSKISFIDDEPPPKIQNSAPLKSFVFYKCTECQISVAHFKNFPKHACNSSGKTQCDQCGIFYNAKHGAQHKTLHQRYSFNRSNVITKTMNKAGKVINIKKQTPEKKDKGSLFSLPSSKTNTQNKDDVDQRPKLYKCFCGLHFTSLNAIERHYKSKNCNTVTREKCSQCNLLFDPIEVVNHLCKHHAQNQTKSFNIVTPNKKTLYKCSLCHVLFYNKISAFPHKAKCTGQFCGKKCEKCGLAFDASSLAIHMVDHERNNKLRNDCYVIVEIPDATLPEIETGLHPNVIYKCKSCDIHFLRRTSARNHMTKLTDCGSTATETCKICKRKFPVKSIMRHIAWQHKKYKVKEFDVRELTFRVNSKMPKVIKKAETVKPEEKTRKLKTEEVIPKKETVSSTVYRCVKCMLLFTDESTLLTHLEDRCSKELTDECEECSVKFASKNIKEHNRQHGPGVAVSLNIIDDVQACEIPDNETKLSPTPFDPKQHPLYKCLGCNLHYLNKSTLSSHDCNPSAIVNCEICELSFTKKSLYRHKIIHEKYHLKKEDIIVLTSADCGKRPATPVNVTSPVNVTKKDQNDQISLKKPYKEHVLDRYDNKLYKCTVCKLHYLTQSTLEKHKDCIPNVGTKCDECDILFTEYSLKRHKSIHEKYNFKKEDFVILTLDDLDPRWIQRKTQNKREIEEDSLDSSSTLESKVLEPTENIELDKPQNEEPKKETNVSNKHFLYKCAECNVHYITLMRCHKHIVKHTPLDPKEYIECKLCGLQFTLMGLPAHIKKHHDSPFNLNEVLIEEYQPDDVKTCETYYANEKDQSTLVSTSEDVKIVLNLRKENDCEVSSCNEIAESVDSSDNSKQDVDITDKSNDLEVIKPSSSKVVDSTDNTMDTDLADDKTEVNSQVDNFEDITETNPSNGPVESADNNSIQDSIDAKDNTTLINKVSNDIEMTESNSCEDKTTVDPSNTNSEVVSTADNIKINSINDESNEITEPIS